ncbi:hypothetical protein KFL_009160030 [Klebsormidium nitens]|uniref:Actin-binding transcription modulator n=1 Tax=Klebsormidium nitens TaxID=105231 RepID=A0A1Y1ITS0_KLENI|nr:hypothetical protein KFL_009160030 [Klebsormidium nitens]|eukprot:GAQ92067.1 hypothetical protein KFL_009160030 [Klebsormidium nitens]
MEPGSAGLEQQEDDYDSAAYLAEDVKNLPERPVPAVQRNFTQYFALDVNGIQGHDQYIYRHPNGLCIVGLAPSHPALQPGRNIQRVDFNLKKDGKGHEDMKGKLKRNAQPLQANSHLCKVVMDDGMVFNVRYGLQGVLLEKNSRLAEDSKLLQDKAATEGFLAILMPRPEAWVQTEKNLLSLEQYLLQKGSVVPSG